MAGGLLKERHILWILIQQSHESELPGEVKSGQVKRFQATEGEMQAVMARNESGACVLCVSGWHLPQMVVLIRLG